MYFRYLSKSAKLHTTLALGYDMIQKNVVHLIGVQVSPERMLAERNGRFQYVMTRKLIGKTLFTKSDT